MDKQELLEYLMVIEMKIAQLQRDVRNIRGRIEDCEVTRRNDQRDINFFTACQADDDDVLQSSNGASPQ